VTTDSGSQGWIGQEEGIFKKHGLNVTVKFVAGVPELSAAVASGSAQFALSSPISVTDGVNAGVNFTMVAPGILYDKNHGGSALMVRNDRNINSIKDLAGKSVAMNALNSLPYYSLMVGLDQNGVPASSVKLVKLNFPQIPGAIVSGAVDAGIASPPYDALPLYSGKARNLTDLDQLVNGGRDFLTTVWFGKSDWVNSHKNATTQFANAIVETSNWANAPANDAARRALLVKYTKITQQAGASLVMSPFGTSLHGPTSGLDAIIAMMQKYGHLKKSITVDTVAWANAP